MFNAMHGRRDFLKTALVASLITTQLVWSAAARADSGSREGLASACAEQVRAGLLDIGYYEAGPADGPAVLLLHGFPYLSRATVKSHHCWQSGDVVIVPHLREHGPPAFLTIRRHALANKAP